MNKEVIGYAAGIIDGEGSVSISRSIYAPTGNYTYKLVVQVSMRSSAVPDWLYDNFGGHTGRFKQGKRAFGSGYMSKWHINGIKAKEFIELIIPYLIEKKSQAKAAIMFPISVVGTTMPEEQKQIQAAIYTLLKSLNSRKLE